MLIACYLKLIAITCFGLSNKCLQFEKATQKNKKKIRKALRLTESIMAV